MSNTKSVNNTHVIEAQSIHSVLALNQHTHTHILLVYFDTGAGGVADARDSMCQS
jgi:hypothetical protein